MSSFFTSCQTYLKRTARYWRDGLLLLLAPVLLSACSGCAEEPETTVKTRSLADLGYYDLLDIQYQLQDTSFTSIDSDTERAALPLGRNAALTVTGVYEDGREVDLTGTVDWTVSDTDVARVVNGTLYALGEGTATINTLIGEYLAKSALVIDVGPAELRDITVSASDIALPSGTSLQLNVNAVYTDGQLPTNAAISVSAPGITVEPGESDGEYLVTASNGLDTGYKGEISVSLAELPGVSVAIPVDVVAGNLDSVYLSPPVATVSPGDTLGLSALANFTIDGEQRTFNVTQQANWQTDSARLTPLGEGQYQASTGAAIETGAQVTATYSHGGDSESAAADLVVSGITAQCGPSTPLVVVNDPCSVDTNNFYTDGWAGAWRFPQCDFYAALPNSQIRLLLSNNSDTAHRVVDVEARLTVQGDDPETEEIEESYEAVLNATDDFGGFDQVTVDSQSQRSMYVFLNDVQGYLTSCSVKLSGDMTLPAPLRDL